MAKYTAGTCKQCGTRLSVVPAKYEFIAGRWVCVKGGYSYCVSCSYKTDR